MVLNRDGEDWKIVQLADTNRGKDCDLPEELR